MIRRGLEPSFKFLKNKAARNRLLQLSFLKLCKNIDILIMIWKWKVVTGPVLEL